MILAYNEFWIPRREVINILTSSNTSEDNNIISNTKTTFSNTINVNFDPTHIQEVPNNLNRRRNFSKPTLK